MRQYLGLRGQSLSTAIGVVAGLCFFLFGYDQGDMGGFLTISSFLRRFPQVDILDNLGNLHIAQMTGITVGIWNIGCFASAMLSVFVGDRLGRKNMIFMGLGFLLIGEIIQCSSFSWGQFLAGRAVAGFGNGFNTATVPAWQAECTKAHRRGTLLMISAGTCIAAGLAFSYWMDFAFAWLDPQSSSWRVPIALQIAFILIALVVLVFLPESPRWLILQGRENEALNVLSALNDVEPDHDDIRQEFLQIKDAVIEMSKASFFHTFDMGDYRDLHRVVLAVGLQAFQQLGGINFMTQYFALMFLQQYAWTPWKARLLAASAGTEFFLASFVAVVGIDRFWGRRTLMMFGTTGMLLSMIVLCVMVFINSRASLDVGTGFVFVYCTFFAIGWQGMSWLYQVEIVPLRIRGPANALSTASNWLANFIVVLISPIAFNNISYRTYIIFIATNAAILPIIYFFYPETGLRCLEEVDYIFHTANASPHPWLDVRKVAANEPLWYGRDDDVYDYENSEWHQRHVRFSDEVKDSDGTSTTLKGTVDPNEKRPGSGSTSEGVSQERITTDRGHQGGYIGEEAAPSPVISRVSTQERPRTRSSRGSKEIRSAGKGY